MDSQAFEIRFAALQRDQGIHVCAWTDGSVFGPDLFDVGRCFGPGSGMADTYAGSEDLILTPEGHNYYFGDRIALAGDGFQTIYVTNLRDQFSMTERPKPWGKIYLAVVRDRGPNDDPLVTPVPSTSPYGIGRDNIELDFD